MTTSKISTNSTVSGQLSLVTFDCWHTLLYEDDRSSSRSMRVAALAAAANIESDHATQLIEVAWTTHIDQWIAGTQYGSPRMAQSISEQLGLTNHADVCTAFEDAALHGTVHALEGSATLLSELRGRGVETALICDTGFTPGRCVRILLERVGLLDLLDTHVFSDEIGFPKPHPSMFKAALNTTDPKSSIHIGDLRRTDIAGARAVGMKTIRMAATNDDPAQDGLPEADEVVGSYSDVTRAIEKLGFRI